MKDRLLLTCQANLSTSREIGMEWLIIFWENRIKQVKAGEVTDRKFAEWIRSNARYWDNKDRVYADWLNQFAGTFQA